MKHKQPSTDGFVIPRRLASTHGERPTLDAKQPLPAKFLADPAHPKKDVHATQVTGSTRPVVINPEMAHSSDKMPTSNLSVDMNLDEPKKSRRELRREKRMRGHGKKLWIKRGIVSAIIVILLAGLGTGGYFVYKFLSTGSQIFKGNVVSAIFNQGKPLQQDANGRTNILLFGTSEDDPGHPGGDLTDSIMVASINQTTKDAFLVSLPRDLWVDYGRACPAGYQAKLNALYGCFKQTSEEAGQEALRVKAGQVLGLTVQYAVHVNYTALRQAVDAVGGITVTIDSKHPDGVLDRNFDWDCHPKPSQSCFNVKYPNGPAQLDGKHALYLARARGDDPLGRTYGFSESNFDREKYQRAILIALKDKAVSAGTLANPVAVNNLLNALGNNVRTNFDADEIKTLVKLGQDINTNSINSLPLNDPTNRLVTTGNVSGQSIVRPVRGLMDYTDIQAAVKAYATGDMVKIEKAKVDVVNVSGVVGKGQTQANSLEDAGYIIANVTNGPAALNTAAIQIFDLTNKKPGTIKKLEAALGVTAKAGAPAGISSNSDIVVVVGLPPAQ